MGETVRFLSFGAGVQTTALLLMNGEVGYDEVIFADTGGEWPETYVYMEKYSKPYMEQNGIKFTTVKGSVNLNGDTYDNLEKYCLAKRITPSRLQRWQTDRFKIRPIRKYVKEQGWEMPAVAVMGISYDELERMFSPHWREYVFSYPLVDKRMTRRDCESVIRKAGWPVPPKSGCFFCPFQKLAGWKSLYLKHPEGYKRAVVMEENNPRFPEFTIVGRGRKTSLRRLSERFGEGSHKLEDFKIDEQPCDSGHCLV